MIRPFLGKALEPPDPLALDQALSLLEAIGALDGGVSETLTPLGMHLAKLPVDPRIGKVGYCPFPSNCSLLFLAGRYSFLPRLAS